MRWPGTRVVVAGAGVSGAAAAETLLELGAEVTVVDDLSDQTTVARAAPLERRGACLRLGAGASSSLPGQVALVVTSPGWPPRTPLLQQAQARGVDIWSEVELAWRLRTDASPPWLCVTGTNGKTTTVQMLAAILTAEGLRTAAVGNVGFPVSRAAATGGALDVLAVELSSFQLHWTPSLAAHSAAVLNVAPDHLDWYEKSLAAYTADKGRIYQRAQRACVYNVADPVTERLARSADVAEGCRIVGFTAGPPDEGAVGVVGGAVVDRAFGSAVELAAVADVVPSAPHNVANALAAAALARSHGVAPAAVREGLRAFRPDEHRIAEVGSVAGVRFVDDSKATNPHAAMASLLGFDPVVWVAGGLAKGADFAELVSTVRDRLRAVVLLGADKQVIAGALARHAPDVPVVSVEGGETDTVMDRVVAAAVELSRPGDTVLLAPGCASQDMFADYGARGDAFSGAVRRRARPRAEDISR